MVTNTTQTRNGKPKQSGKQSGRQSGKRGKAAADAMPEAAAAEAYAPPGDTDVRETGASAAGATAGRSGVARVPAKVGAGAASRKIRAIADVSESLDVRRRLRRRAKQIERR